MGKTGPMKIPGSILLLNGCSRDSSFDDMGLRMTVAPTGSKSPSKITPHSFSHAALPSVVHVPLPPFFGKATLKPPFSDVRLMDLMDCVDLDLVDLAHK